MYFQSNSLVRLFICFFVIYSPEKPSNMNIPIIVTVVFFVLVLITATGFMFYKKKGERENILS